VSDTLDERILKHLSKRGYDPQKPRALAHDMGLDDDDQYHAFRAALKSLEHSGRVVIGPKNAIALPRMSGDIVGVFRGTSRGFGFVEPTTPDVHGDLFIPPGESADAITGDTVRASLLKRGKRSGKMIFHGRVVEILERGHSRFVGTLSKSKGRWLVEADGRILDSPIQISDVTAKSAQHDDKVVVEIVTYPRPGRDATGVIVEVLGASGRPDVDLRSVIRQFHLRDEFDNDVLNQARRVTAEFESDRAFGKRIDLRDRVIITIDPESARDFDDAISIDVLPDGRSELGVHIADVSYFVAQETPLDEEARLRGNSVYFPNHVIPMLPEVLSNGLCSLQEGQDRLTKSVFITYDDRGRPRKERFAEAIIRSTKRLTYEQATLILSGKTGGYDKKVVELIRRTDTLARTIRERRLQQGMLVLDIPDVELQLNKKGKPVDVVPADTSFSHTIIEMFMVEANEAAARLLDRLDWPALRRIHPEPDRDSLISMSRLLSALGHRVPSDMDRKGMQDLLDKTRDRPEGFPVHLAILRSFQQAVYSPKRVGHFALASEHYAHFTSPIRRYPDLLVHRLLTETLKLKSRRKKVPPPDFAASQDVDELGRHCSFTERRAEDAERELRAVYVLRMLSSKIGDEFEGVITGVANFGVFVQLQRYLIDGLIRMEDLGDDWWEVNNRDGYLIGQRTGARIQIGDRVVARIVSVDVPARQLNLVLVDRQESRPNRKKDDKSSKAISKKRRSGRSARSTKRRVR
jgi:ribonuclease R